MLKLYPVTPGEIYLPCVYQTSMDIELDTLLYGRLKEYPISEMEWRKSDGKLKKNHSEHCFAARNRHFNVSDCDCYQNESQEYWYTDGKVWRTRKGTWSVKGHTYFLVQSELYLTVLKSPWAWERGLCSPCFPGQCDASSRGGVQGTRQCYALPDVFLSDYFLKSLREERGE